MRKRTICSFSVLLLLVFTSFAVAQTGQGVVTGTVLDPAGAAVPNANVTLTNEGTSIKQETKSSDDGTYRFSLVPPGSYTLDVQASGFAQRQIKSVAVAPSQTL